MKEALTLAKAVNKLSLAFGVSMQEAAQSICSVMQSLNNLSQSISSINKEVLGNVSLLEERELTLLGTESVVSSKQKSDLEKIEPKDDFEDFEIKIISMQKDFDNIINELRKEDNFDINK